MTRRRTVTYTRIMADGQEEREEQRTRLEQERQQGRDYRAPREYYDDGAPERPDS